MKRTVVTVAFLLVSLMSPLVASASHSWNGYHWTRTVNPFTLKLGDNVSGIWDAHLATASGDWSQSTVLDTPVVSGLSNVKNCKPTSGRVEVCNNKYGNNGWLGIAQIWASGSHIYKGATKVNDTYFSTPTYNTTAWRNLVMCQEIGHTLGLDHQDETFNNPNLGTCMDYTNNPSTNQHPNQHDYDELGIIYAHLDSFTTIGQISSPKMKGDFENRSEWGKQVKAKGKTAVIERDLGGGHKLFTFVIFTVDN